jgi:hypothetical protein
MTAAQAARAARLAKRAALREQMRKNAERMASTPARGSDGPSGRRSK